MNQDLTLEDRTILAALEALEAGSGQPSGSVEPTETAETLARLYTEVLGLVPCELAPGRPRPELRERILAVARGEASPGPEPKPGPKPEPKPLIVRREMPLPRPARPAVRRSSWSAWAWALAATLILALGGLSGWLLQQRVQQEATIRGLQARLSEEQRKAEQSGAVAVAGVRQQMERMRQNFSLVTSPAVISSLHPAEGSGAARGMLFVAADHQHWYLALHGLPPAEPGREYQLWWISGDGSAASGGTFGAREDKVELYSESMPADTKDVVITLEAEGGAARPTGPKILRAAGFYPIS